MGQDTTNEENTLQVKILSIRVSYDVIDDDLDLLIDAAMMHYAGVQS